ncbi:hypothetical protein AB7M17_004234 [Bradyrhizobium sp. USDA 377]
MPPSLPDLSSTGSGLRHFQMKQQRRRFDEHINWLGREGSNLRMAESKSVRLFNDFNPRLEKAAKPRSSNFNKLAAVSK